MADSLKWKVLCIDRFLEKLMPQLRKNGKIDAFSERWKNSVFRQWRNQCISNGENGEKLVFQQRGKWAKFGVSATVKTGVSAMGKRDAVVKEE